MKRIIAFSILALIACAASPTQAKGPFGSIKLSNWIGGAYTDDKTGSFSHCGAGTSYQNGVSLVVSENVQGQWTILLSHPSFNYKTGEAVQFDVIFDGQHQVRLFGNAPAPQVVVAPLPSNTFLRKSHLMVAEINGATYQFQLNSIDRILSIVENCVVKSKSAGVENAGDFSVTVPKPVAQTAPPTAKPPPPKPAKTVEQTGTGFVVSTSGHIVTNYHVVDGCVGDINGNLTGEGATVLRVVSTDETNDLALLQAPKSFTNVAIIRGTAIHSGDAVIAIGYPFHGLLTSDFTVTAGIVSSLSGLLNDTRFLQISAGVQSGNSGGPLLDTSGNVVGVVAAKINAIKFAKATGDLPENINFAIKTGAVRDFLDNSAVSYQTAEPNLELKTADIASKARAYTMLITCTAKEKD